MQLETQCYRGYTRTGTLSQETAAECRFGGAVETVLSAHAELLPVPATAGEGGVRVLGRARFSLVYENAEHGVCRVEKGALPKTRTPPSSAVACTGKSSACAERTVSTSPPKRHPPPLS